MKLICFLVMVLSMLTACRTGNDKVLIVAHRGASYDAPENTMAAFELAWEQGADAIEGDFYLTRDGQVVTFHDPTAKRTAGVDRNVQEMTLQELQALDVGSWKDTRWSAERAPTLERVLGCVPEGKKIFIEVKSGPAIVPALQRGMEASGLCPEQMVIICFKEEVVAACKLAMPHIRAYWLHAFKVDKKTGRLNITHDEAVATATRIHADGLDLNANEFVTRELVDKMKAAGLELHVWTVNDPAVAEEMIALGALSITTDRPKWLRKQLSRIR